MSVRGRDYNVSVAVGALKRRKNYLLHIDFETNELVWFKLGEDGKEKVVKRKFSIPDCIKVDAKEGNKASGFNLSLSFRTDKKEQVFSQVFTFVNEDDRGEFVDVVRAIISTGPQIFERYKREESVHGAAHHGSHHKSPTVSSATNSSFVSYLLDYAQQSGGLPAESSMLRHSTKDAPTFAPQDTDKDTLRNERMVEMSPRTSLIYTDNSLSRGEFTLTNYRIKFHEYSTVYTPEQDIPLASIDKVSLNNDRIQVTTKSARTAVFAFDSSSSWVTNCFKKILQYAHPRDQTRLFAFQYGEGVRQDLRQINGWALYDPRADYARLELAGGNPSFKLIENKEFYLCKTYPPFLVIPSAINDEQLKEVAKFRSGSRLPAIVWKHPVTQATLSRCSQPKAGLGKTCDGDVALFAALRDAAPQGKKKLYIIDARPYKAALGNTLKGKGYESMSTYKYCQLEFQGIENIHVIRGSLEKLRELVADLDRKFQIDPNRNSFEDSAWLTRLESSKWLYHVRVMLEAGSRVSGILDQEGAPVVIHCSDGWDRTGQLTSLTQLLLDPFYRTLAGFAILIEKDWLSFGHKFAERYAHGEPNKSSTQTAPVFTHFIDGVWQLTQQFPKSFEFNEAFLIAVLDHASSCCYGTFLYNSFAERIKHNVPTSTVSLWSDLLDPERIDTYRNPLYRAPNPEEKPVRLIPNCSASVLGLWRNYHLRWIRPSKFQPVTQPIGTKFYVKEERSSKSSNLDGVHEPSGGGGAGVAVDDDEENENESSINDKSNVPGLRAGSAGSKEEMSNNGDSELSELLENYKQIRQMLLVRGVELERVDDALGPPSPLQTGGVGGGGIIIGESSGSSVLALPKSPSGVGVHGSQGSRRSSGGVVTLSTSPSQP